MGKQVAVFVVIRDSKVVDIVPVDATNKDTVIAAEVQLKKRYSPNGGTTFERWDRTLVTNASDEIARGL
jgi:hypothetical protein